MRKSRFSSVLSLGLVGAFALSACASTSSSSSNSASDSSANTAVSIAITNQFTSLNSGTPTGNVDTNGMIANMTGRGFYTVTDKQEIKHNDWFGKFSETDNGEGIKVNYSVNEGQKWSDGNAIDKGDLMLSWAILSGYFDSKEKSGVHYFDYAGETLGLGQAGKPEFGADNRSVTFTYPTKFADWNLAFDIGTPAHVVAKLAGMSEDDLIKTLEEAQPGVENANLKKIAEAWNTGYNTTTMPTNKDLLVNNGPYLVSGVVENQSVTLTKNPNYQGPTKPSIGEITLKLLPEAPAQVQALTNGEVDVVHPQASVDTVQQLQGVAKATTVTYDDMSYDHLDLNMVKGGVFEDANVRKAFLLTIPRQDIVDKLIKPMNSNAKVLNSELFVTSQKDYAEAVSKNNSSSYPTDKMDSNIAKAKELLGGKTPTVRILFNNKNPNRVDTFQMIKESAEKAGFVIENLGDEKWSKILKTGKDGAYDASIFGWVSSGVGNSTVGQIFKTGSGSNYNSYSNPTVDSDAEQILKTTDESKIKDLTINADGELFKDGYGLPLFQLVGVVSYNKAIKGIKPKPGQYTATWNVEEWTM